MMGDARATDRLVTMYAALARNWRLVMLRPPQNCFSNGSAGGQFPSFWNLPGFGFQPFYRFTICIAVVDKTVIFGSRPCYEIHQPEPEQDREPEEACSSKSTHETGPAAKFHEDYHHQADFDRRNRNRHKKIESSERLIGKRNRQCEQHQQHYPAQDQAVRRSPRDHADLPGR